MSKKTEVPLKPPAKQQKPLTMTISINTGNAITTGQAAFRAQLKAQREGKK